jgi:hypothetical protein
MIRLHLVGFTTDLKNLIFANERGATSGGYVVSLDARLRHTLEEVARMQEEAADQQEDRGKARPGIEQARGAEEPSAPAKRVRAFEDVHSKLTPKEIQALVRQGKSEEQVAKLAQTDVAWVRRFAFPILAERAGVIEAVRSARLSKPRLGPSAVNIGQAVEENLGARRLRMGPDEFGDSWKAVRKNGRWQVSFEYSSRGRRRLARFSYDPDTRQVDALNDVALELGYKSGPRAKAAAALRAPAASTRAVASTRTPPVEGGPEGRQRPRPPARGGASSSQGTDAGPRPTSPSKSIGTRPRGPAQR